MCGVSIQENGHLIDRCSSCNPFFAERISGLFVNLHESAADDLVIRKAPHQTVGLPCGKKRQLVGILHLGDRFAHSPPQSPALSIHHSKRAIRALTGRTTSQSFTLKSCGRVVLPK
jgi:hypothetical protein